jgi:hypothetical protein
MARLQIWGAVVAALLAAFLGGGAWVFHALDQARAQGLEAGRAEVSLALETQAARQRAAAADALARTNAEVADLERARDQLQETYDALLAQSIRDPGHGRLCLDPGLVRALDAIGRD